MPDGKLFGLPTVSTPRLELFKKSPAAQEDVSLDQEKNVVTKFAGFGTTNVVTELPADANVQFSGRYDFNKDSPMMAELNNDEDSVEEKENSSTRSKIPFSNKSALVSSTTSSTRQMSESLADFIILEDQIDDELNSSVRHLLREENEALKQQMRIVEDENFTLKADLAQKTKALEIAEKERNDYRFLFEQEAGKLKESNKKLMQQRVEYENKMEEAYCGRNAAEELRLELANERELNGRLLEDLKQAIKEKEAADNDALCGVIKQLEEKNELQSAQISKLESNLLESTSICEHVLSRFNSLEEEHKALHMKEKTHQDQLSMLSHAADERNILKATLAERQLLLDGMKADFLNIASKNAEAIAHLKQELDYVKKSLSEKTTEAQAFHRKVNEFASRLAEKTEECERAWKACEEMEAAESDYKVRIGQLSNVIDMYKARCDEDSTFLQDALRRDIEQPLSPSSDSN